MLSLCPSVMMGCDRMAAKGQRCSFCRVGTEGCDFPWVSVVSAGDLKQATLLSLRGVLDM